MAALPWCRSSQNWGIPGIFFRNGQFKSEIVPEAELAQELQGSCWTVGPGECPWGHGEATAGTWGVAGAEASVPIAPGEPGLSSGSSRDQLRTFWSRAGRDIQGKAGAVGSCAWFSWCFEEKEWFGWELCSPGPQRGGFALVLGPWCPP